MDANNNKGRLFEIVDLTPQATVVYDGMKKGLWVAQTTALLNNHRSTLEAPVRKIPRTHVKIS